MHKRPIFQRYAQNDQELLVYHRFKIICKELQANLDPPTGARKNKAYQAAMPGLIAAAIAMLESGAIPKDDWPEYLELAFASGIPEVLQAAIKAMPSGARCEHLWGSIPEIAKTAPVEHLLLAADAGLVKLTPSKHLISAALSRNSEALQARIISHVDTGMSGLGLEDWFVGMRSEQMAKGADFLDKLLSVYVARHPRDASNGLMTSITRKRGLHALVLHLAGARIEALTQTAWDHLNNHQIMSLLGGCSTIEALLSDPSARFRAQDFLAD